MDVLPNPILAFLKAASDAPGLPDRTRYTPLPDVPKGKGKTWPMAMQEHQARVAGRHHDLRIADPSTGIAYSWAYRSGKLPGVGEKIEVFQQPDHTQDYMRWEGTIPKGYGAGKVRVARARDVEVLDSGPEKLHFRMGRRRFVLLKTPRYGKRSWLFVGLPSRSSPSRRPGSAPGR